jgi:hypothetical protein
MQPHTCVITGILAATTAPAFGEAPVGVRVKSTLGTAADVGAALEKVEPQLRTCWAAPPAGSLAALAWLVFDAKGKVTRADVVAADGAAVEACVGKVLRTTVIPASPLGKPAAVAIELVIPTTAFSIQAVHDVLRAHQRDFTRCWAKRNPSAPPAVVRKFTIGATGRVASVDITTGDADIDGCLRKAISALEFPPPGTPVTVTFPFASDPA